MFPFLHILQATIINYISYIDILEKKMNHKQFLIMII